MRARPVFGLVGMVLLAALVLPVLFDRPAPVTVESLRLHVGDETCPLAIYETFDGTPALGLQPGPCGAVLERLQVPVRGVLWLAITTENDPNRFLPLLQTGFPDPPALDERGRYFGCSFLETGRHLCRVEVILDDSIRYRADVPVMVVAPPEIVVPGR